ncbi:MAG: aminoacyl--tRNA ligase-related protein [Patescibacteria group bacterium]|jgi:prolyl-tRNA synthetase
MRQSQLFTKTSRQAPAGETSINAQLLERAGFVTKHMAGVYNFLPLGWRVMTKIANIIREEMNAVGGQEVLFTVLQPKELWDKSGRWQGMKEVMYQFEDYSGKPVGLAVTHEEVVADTIKRFVRSYKDLPFALYQIQTKFRHELRAKSGLNRGREFLMKDMYSCHITQDDCDKYYETVMAAYTKIFDRIGLATKIVEASGGDFTDDNTHEWQVLTDVGEDHIFWCDACNFAQNKEIARVKDGDACPNCAKGKIKVSRGIEVGNIFKLGTRYSEAIGVNFADRNSKPEPVVMASYGIGVSRAMGTTVEMHHDANGMIWPESIAPFQVHLIRLGDTEAVKKQADKMYHDLNKRGVEVLYDDRETSAGEKFKDSDLIGIPHRLVVSERSGVKFEYRRRGEQSSRLVTATATFKLLKR